MLKERAEETVAPCAMSLINQSTIKTVIVEDQPDIREGLCILINGTEGYHCTGTYSSMEEAIEGIEHNVPDVMLCDIGLPGMSGIEGIRILKQQYPRLLLLMLSVYDDDERIFDAICAGACGYLLKRTSPSRLLEGIREAVTGGTPISPEVAARVLNLFVHIPVPELPDCALTPNEVRLLELIVEGYNYTTAAEELTVNYDSVKFHMRHIYEKLQVYCSSESVERAMRERLPN
jgi:DNA-binding NarL/FixJ family response regulator